MTTVTKDEATEDIELAGQNEPILEGEDQSTLKDESAPEGQNDENEVEVTIGEPPAEEVQKAPEWVRELRKTNRELQREKKELEAKLNAREAESKPAPVAKRPLLEDYDFDEDKLAEATDKWYEAKHLADLEADKERQAKKAQDDAWQAKLNDYGKLKAEIRVSDFDEAEAETQTLLNVTQQGIVLQGADNPALVVYALGKNHAKAKELAAIADPVKFAFAIARLESQLKVTDKKPIPAPERTITGTGKTSGSIDSTLERLREDAAKTGDYTKVTQYKAQKRKT
jgi:hypothetical protein